MDNILLIGTLIPTEHKDPFIRNGISPAPADIAQTYMISGLCDFVKKKVSISAICSPRIACFPKTNIKKVKYHNWKLNRCNVRTIGFINIPIIGFIRRERNMIKEAKKWAIKNRQKENIIIVYSMNSSFLKVALTIKKICYKTQIAVVVPDLPIYMSDYGLLKKFLKKIDEKRINILRKNIHKYILYTKYMADYFKLKKNEWIVMEGLIDTKKIVEKPLVLKNDKIYMYAGSLDKKYAIEKMIISFERIRGAELHIYGNKREFNMIKDSIKIPSNVKYKGCLKPSEVFEKMREASILINPRPSNLPLTKYSCPSKTFEYMASGTPVLMTKLPGLPKEYYEYIYLIEDESLEGFERSITNTQKIDDYSLWKKGIAAQKYLVNNKNSKYVMQNVLKFILE